MEAESTATQKLEALRREKDKQIEKLTKRLDMLESFTRDPEKFIRMRDEAFAMDRQAAEETLVMFYFSSSRSSKSSIVTINGLPLSFFSLSC